RPLATRDVHHSSHEKTHHVMKKAIRLDLEHQSAVPFAPRCVHDVAAMVIAGRSRPSNRECPETVLACELRRGVVEQLSLDWPDERPLRPASKGRRRPLVRTDVITVPARRGAVSRV